MRRIPFLGPCVSLILGILAIDCGADYGVAAVVAFLGVLFLFPLFVKSDSQRCKTLFSFFLSASVLILFFSAGIVLRLLKDGRSDFQDIDKPGVFIASVVDVPIEHNKTYSVEAEVHAFAEDSCRFRFRSSSGRVVLYLPKAEETASLRIGDTLVFCGKVTMPSPEIPEAFDYGDYLRKNGIGGMAMAYDSAHWRLLSHSDRFSFFQFFSDVRFRLLSVFSRYGISDDELSIVSALTLGYKRDLSHEVKENYSRAGVMHLLAVSGLHVGVVAAVLSFLFGFLAGGRFQRRLRFLLVILFIWIYAILTGLSPSVVRASFMTTVVLLGFVVHRSSSVLNSLCISALVMLVIDPYNIYNVGFQLSYSAVIGIVMFHKPIASYIISREYWKKASWRHTPIRKVLLYLIELTIVSVSAQLATLPLSVYYFHKYSVYFLLANYLAIPMATVIIWLALSLLVLSWIPLLSSFVAYLLNAFLLFQNSFIESLAQLPHSVLWLWITPIETFFFSLSVALVCVALHRRSLNFVTLSMLSLLMVFSLRAYRHHWYSRENLFVVYQQRGKVAKNLSCECVSGFSHVLYTTDSASILPRLQNFYLSRGLGEPSVVCVDSSLCVVSCGGFRAVLIPDGVNLRHKMSSSPLRVDAVVISGGAKVYYQDLRRLFVFDELVLCPTVSRRMSDKLTELASVDSVGVYSMYERGLYIRSIR